LQHWWRVRPIGAQTCAKLLANKHITFVETRHGGHCAYLSKDRGDDIHWAEAAVIRYLMLAAGQSNGS
jgi:predicted alpha/beta-fold hydrolase